MAIVTGSSLSFWPTALGELKSVLLPVRRDTNSTMFVGYAIPNTYGLTPNIT